MIEQAFQCSLNVAGSPQVGVLGNVTVTATVLGAPMSGLEVTLVGGDTVTPHFPVTGTTNGAGQAVLSYKPVNTTALDLNVADVPNMLGCSATKSVAAAAAASASKIAKVSKATKKMKKAQRARNHRNR